MQIKEKIKVLQNLSNKIRKSLPTEFNCEYMEKNREIFVLDEISSELMRSIGMKTIEEKNHEKEFTLGE